MPTKKEQQKIDTYKEIIEWREDLERAIRLLVADKVGEYEKTQKKSDDVGEFLAVTQAAATALASVSIASAATIAAVMGTNSMGKDFFETVAKDFETVSIEFMKDRGELLEKLGAVSEEKEESITPTSSDMIH